MKHNIIEKLVFVYSTTDAIKKKSESSNTCRTSITDIAHTKRTTSTPDKTLNNIE